MANKVIQGAVLGIGDIGFEELQLGMKYVQLFTTGNGTAYYPFERGAEIYIMCTEQEKEIIKKRPMVGAEKYQLSVGDHVIYETDYDKLKVFIVHPVAEPETELIEFEGEVTTLATNPTRMMQCMHPDKY